MKKITLAMVFVATGFLVGCGGDSSSITITEVNPAAGETEKSRIQFQPGEGRLALPNDILFSGTADGTLEPPDESSAKASGVAVDLSNPAAALGAVDGWSTSTPMLLTLDMAQGSSIDAGTVGASSIIFVETDCAPGLTNCNNFVPLSYGVDYVAQAVSSNTSTGSTNLAIVPMRPLKSATTYLVGVTAALQDSRGEAIVGSEFYQQVSRDDVDLSNSDTLGPLQAAINGYEVLLAAATGLSADVFAYTAAWTTGSAGAGFTGVLAQLAQTSALAPATLSITEVAHAGGSPQPVTVRDALITNLTAQFVEEGLDQASALAQATAAVPEAFANGFLLQASLTLPYYSGTPEDGSDPLLNGWRAACDSGAILAGASPETLAAATPGVNDTFCTAFGLRDLGLDVERYITRFNPIPQARAQVALQVQITLPNPALIPAPWPVVIVQHSIGSRKEDTLALSAALSAAGVAAFAIDHPLHSSRALVSESAGGATVNALQDPTVYMNLAHLPTVKDNLNQSVADMLGLRAAISNGISGVYSSEDFDLNEVRFFGMSLGAITGVSFLDQAQASAAFTTALQLPPLDLSITRGALAVPGGGIAPLLIDSARFGPLVKGSVLAGLAGEEGPQVANAFVAFIGSNTNCDAADIGCHYAAYIPTVAPADLAVVEASVAQYAFAAQTIINSADPLNYAARLASAGVDLLVLEFVGDGADNLPDQVVPNQTSVAGFRFGGTEPLAAVLDLVGVDGDNAPQDSGIVRYTAGHHASILRAQAQAQAAATAEEIAVQTEIQSSVAGFLAGLGINIFDSSVVAPAPEP